MNNIYITTYRKEDLRREVDLDLIYSPGADIALLRKGLEWAEAEAARGGGRWDQGVWLDAEYQVSTRVGSYDVFTCGSSYCLYGNLALTVGDYFLVPDSVEDMIDYLVVDRGEDGWVLEDIRERIDDLLGINVIAGDELSHPYNSIEDLRVIAEAIAGEPL